MWSSAALPLVYALLELSSSTSSTVSAQSIPGLPISGPLSPGPGNTAEARRVSEEAGRNPNATTSVTFQRKYNGTKEDWTWRVNLTEIAVPDDISDLGSPSAEFSKGLHLVNAQWQLEWPGSGAFNGNGTFEEFLLDRNLNASFTSLVVKHSSKISDDYDDDDDGDCKKVLGKDCAQALTDAASKSLTSQLSTISQCKSVFGNDGSKLDDGVGFQIDGEKPANASEASKFLKRDGTLLYRASKAYASDDDSDTFNDAKGALYIFTMRLTGGGGDGDSDDNNDRGDSDADPTILCRVLDKDAGSPAAVSWHRPTVALWSAVLLGAVFTAL